MSTSDYWIFRDESEPVCGAQLVNEVRRLTRRAQHSPCDSDAAADALIRAGSLECGLADINSASANTAADVTDALARNLLQGDAAFLEQALSRLDQFEVPQSLAISQPEGFSYYALHPCDFSTLAEELPLSAGYAVIGIRSVGTTLSAMITARLAMLGRHAQRITVRPTGHPYDRNLQLTTGQRAWVTAQQARASRFVIVDEGPGRSGSTFLSVAEALEAAGVPRQQIVLAGSHTPDTVSLCARNAEERWRGLNFLAAKRWACRPYQNLPYLGGGDWRRALMSEDERAWPACWPQMERLKFLSADRAHIIKFEGLSSQGESARARGHCLAESGFGPPFERVEAGFVYYPTIVGVPLRSQHVTRADLERLAAYCSFRQREFRCERRQANFANMISFNLSLEFGAEIHLRNEAFDTRTPVITDSRMAPHEWIRNEKGVLLKTDGVSHGDDHFFPGPVDIAWDLAGTVIEWKLSGEAEEYLLEVYRKQTGDNARARMLSYKVGYAAFRLAWCRMALPTTEGTKDEARLLVETGRYLNFLKLLLWDVTGGRAELTPAA